MHTQESTVHKSSSTCIAAKHTSVANETPEEHNKKKINLFLSKTIWNRISIMKFITGIWDELSIRKTFTLQKKKEY